MREPGGQSSRFVEVWPLHGLRYGMVALGIGSWLWEGKAAVSGTHTAVLSLLVGSVLVVELFLHGPLPHRAALLWALAQLVLGLGAFFLEPGFSLALVLAAIVTGIALELPWRWALAMAATAGAGSAAAIAVAGEQAKAFLMLLPAVTLYAMALALGRLAALRVEERRVHERTVSELQEAEARLSRMAATARELAAAEEHRRLSEELHDTLGHALVGTLLQVQLAKRLLDTDAVGASRRLDLVERSVRETLESVRHALHRGKRGAEALPLHRALESLAAEFRALGGPEVTLVFRPDGDSVSDLSPEVRDALFRTVQEALTNSVRHGNARHVVIEAEASGPRLYLAIKDDGIGASSYAPGMGLLGMVSRIQAVGGALKFQSDAGQGFHIHVGVRRW